MGRGDKKTKRGKIFSSSYGKLRPRKVTTKKYAVKPKKTEELKIVEEIKVKETKKTATAKKKSTTKKNTKKKS